MSAPARPRPRPRRTRRRRPLRGRGSRAFPDASGPSRHGSGAPARPARDLRRPPRARGSRAFPDGAGSSRADSGAPAPPNRSRRPEERATRAFRGGGDRRRESGCDPVAPARAPAPTPTPLRRPRCARTAARFASLPWRRASCARKAGHPLLGCTTRSFPLPFGRPSGVNAREAPAISPIVGFAAV